MAANQYPFWYGGLASVAAAVCTHPLDLAKVRMQMTPDKPVGFITTLYRAIRFEGPLAIYSGLSASILRQATYSTARFGTYERLKGMYMSSRPVEDRDKTPPSYILLPLSMVSGLIGGVVGNPADIANIRMQNDKALPEAERRNYRNAVDALIRMTREEGPGALFRGLVPNCARGILMTSSQVVSYDRCKDLLVDTFGLDKDRRSTHFSASLMAGLVATTVCSPVDVVKTRIMSAQGSGLSTVGILVSSVQQEGILFAFRGWLPAFVRLGPHTILTFLVLEQLKHSRLGMGR